MRQNPSKPQKKRNLITMKNNKYNKYKLPGENKSEESILFDCLFFFAMLIFVLFAIYRVKEYAGESEDIHLEQR